MEILIGAVSGVAVAIVGGGGPLMWFLTRFDKRNTSQHGALTEVVFRIENKVDRMDQKVDHIEGKVIHVDTKVLNVDNKVADIHERVASLEKPKITRSKLKSV
jgi:peptidoglycan hydrolase CwlO-like protein